MAEEIRRANVVIPWCMVSTTLLNGILGFAIVIVVLFVTVDIDGVLASPTGLLGFPFMQIFYDATGSLAGASVMICIIIIMDICAAIAFLATSSRIVFAFGRDRGLPFWRTMSKVCWSFLPSTSSPDETQTLPTGPSRFRYSIVRNHGHGGRILRHRLDQYWFRNCLQRRYLCRCQQPLRILRHHRSNAPMAPHQRLGPSPKPNGRYNMACQRTGLGPLSRSWHLGHSPKCLRGRLRHHRFHLQLLSYNGQP